MTTPEEHIAAIRKALDAGPTPGEWKTQAMRTDGLITRVVGDSDVVDGLDGICEPDRINDRTFEESRRNMDFIASCDPVAISAVLSELDRLKAENERLRAENAKLTVACATYEADAAWLREQLDEARNKALDEAAAWHNANAGEYTNQMAENKAHLARTGGFMPGSRGNEYCFDQRSMHRVSAAAIRAMKENKNEN